MNTFDYRAFLSIADELGQRSDQASRRTALGRAYYAILGIAYRALPAADRARIGPGQIHDHTWSLFASSTVQSSRRVGGIGYRLRTARRRADYRDDLSFSDRDVEFVLREARQALQLLDRHGYQP